jgi:NADPH:quinone reductase-like Zn-dependent oxidoreductase
MKAARFSRFGGPEVLELVDLPDPQPGPGEVRIAVRAAGVNASDWKKRSGHMDPELPQTLGYEAAGVADAVGDGVADVAIGDRVFGFCTVGAAQAELAVMSTYAPIPESLDFATAATLPAALETAARALDQLGVAVQRGEAGTVDTDTAGATGDARTDDAASRARRSSVPTLLINGASGTVGSAAVQLAVARGAHVIGTAGPSNQDFVRSLGAEAVVYGDGLLERVRELAPHDVDLALDVAGNGILPELIELTGSPENVITVADFLGALEHGVRFSRGDSGRALYVLGEIGGLIESGRFTPPDVLTFPLDEIAEAHRVGEHGHQRAKLVLTVE